MSSQAQASPKYFFVYAPDKTEEGTFERRMSVRPKHLEVAHERTTQGAIRVAGGLLTPESIESPDAVKKLIGSTFIFQAQSLDEVKKLIESDVYYQAGVWDPERIVITPYAPATPLP